MEITPATVTYSGSERRTDCMAAPTCTYVEETRNFANWFSYYRTRELSAKAAYGQMIATVDNARMGLISLHDNNGVNTCA